MTHDSRTLYRHFSTPSTEKMLSKITTYLKSYSRNMRVDCYLNLNDDCVSVKSRESGDYGVVVSHEQKVHLRDVEFVVQPAGRENCRKEKVKNVHAFVRGKWDESVNIIDGDYVTYNPFRYDEFYSPDLDAYVTSAERVAVTQKGVFAEGLSE